MVFCRLNSANAMNNIINDDDVSVVKIDLDEFEGYETEPEYTHNENKASCIKRQIEHLKKLIFDKKNPNYVSFIYEGEEDKYEKSSFELDYWSVNFANDCWITIMYILSYVKKQTKTVDLDKKFLNLINNDNVNSEEIIKKIVYILKKLTFYPYCVALNFNYYSSKQFYENVLTKIEEIIKIFIENDKIEFEKEKNATNKIENVIKKKLDINTAMKLNLKFDEFLFFVDKAFWDYGGKFELYDYVNRKNNLKFENLYKDFEIKKQFENYMENQFSKFTDDTEHVDNHHDCKIF